MDPRGFKNLNLYVLSLKEINADENTLPKIVNDIYSYLEDNHKADKRIFRNYLFQADTLMNMPIDILKMGICR